jgi:opacity protein-like surface antigen
MRSSSRIVRILCAAGILAAVPSITAAQAPFPRGLGGFVSGSLGDGGPAPAVGVTATIRVTQTLRFEVNGSYRPDLDFGQIPLCPPDAACILASETSLGLFRAGAYNVHARARSATVSLVTDLPIRFGAVQPYVAAGGGLANVRRELRDTELPNALTRTSTDPMLTVGGGVDVPLTDRIVLGLDARFERVFSEQQFDRPDMPKDLNLTRVGVVVRYRF